MTNFNALPTDVQTQVKQLLKAYDNANVTFENGTYNVSPNTCLKATYSADFKVVGRYDKNQVFTADEQLVNYLESFHDYPTNFTGKRDYKLINQLNVIGWSAKIELTENSFIIL